MNFSKEALECIEETGINAADDLERLKRGELTCRQLLIDCLDGADFDREQGWRDYVAELGRVFHAATTYVALGNVTPNRGTVLYVGTDRDAAVDACNGAGGETRLLTEHPRSAETIAVGARAYHDRKHAWISVGY